MRPRQPSGSSAVASPNIRFVGHSDQGGRSDGVQVMVHRGHAYIGHTFSNGITILDVRDPVHPQTVEFIACPPNTRAVHLQTHEDLLLAVNGPSVWHMQEFQNLQDYFEASPADKLRDRAGSFASGIRVFDISRPEKPAEIGFMPVDGIGPHRIWYTGGRYAYASIHFADFTDHILAVVDMSNPRAPGGRRPLVAPRHVARRGRDADLAQGPALRAPPRPGRRRPRLRGLARRGPDRPRRRRPDPAPAARPPQLGSALRRRHALAASAARPESPGRRRRAHHDELQPGAPLRLDVRRAGAEQPREHRHLPLAVRGGLLPEGRQLRPAQPPREPARRPSRARA